MRKLKLYFITSNKHKYHEIRRILELEAPWIEFEVASNVQKLEIQSDDLKKIVLFAAENALQGFDEPFIIEEAGLFIDALGGFPGPYSSYVYKTIGCDGILKLMHGVQDRSAEFQSVIALHYGGIIKLFLGRIRGVIAGEKRGASGFGFDPIFIPENDNRTFAEMSTDEKNLVSHRGKSARKMILFLRDILR